LSGFEFQRLDERHGKKTHCLSLATLAQHFNHQASLVKQVRERHKIEVPLLAMRHQDRNKDSCGNVNMLSTWPSYPFMNYALPQTEEKITIIVTFKYL